MPQRYRLAVKTASRMEPVYSVPALPQEVQEVAVVKTRRGLQRCQLLQADRAMEQVRNLECLVVDVAVYLVPL